MNKNTFKILSGLVVLFILIFVIIQIGYYVHDKVTKNKNSADYINTNYTIIVIDSCEYVRYDYPISIAHKGNCKYCLQRQKIESEQMLNNLK
jgi:hypothetical protein